MLVKVANIKHFENPFSGMAFLHVDTLTDAVKEPSTLLQLLPVNTPTVSLSPKWHLSHSVFSVTANKNQDIGNLFHETIMLALTSANSRLCRWNSRESCSPTATRTLSLVMAAVGMSNSMGLSDLASSLQTFSLEYNRASNRIYFNQPHITLLQVFGHHLYELLHCFTTNTISCNLCYHQTMQNSSVWNPALPEEQTFHHSTACVAAHFHTCSLYVRDAKHSSPRWCRWLNCVRWCLIFVSLQHRTSIMSPFWHPEFWVHSRISGKFLHPWYKAWSHCTLKPLGTCPSYERLPKHPQVTVRPLLSIISLLFEQTNN